MLLEQGAALALGHAAPYAELHAVVQGVSSAFGDDRTVSTDHCGFSLGCPTHEELVGIGRPA